jgi:hypothetical protein
MNDKALIGWLGQWELIRLDKGGNVIETTGLRPNLLMDAGLNMIRDVLSGTISDAEIKYVALGSDATEPANSQTQLVAEEFRKIVTSQTDDPVTVGVLHTELFISDAEANSFKTEEIGWFAGAAAGAGADTGIMVARVLYSRQKTDEESWTIYRTDTMARGS